METYIAQCRVCARDVLRAERYGENELESLAAHMSRNHGVDLWRDGYGEREQAGEVLKHYTVRAEEVTKCAS